MILRAGSVFELAGPPHDGYGDLWVVASVRHEGEAPESSVHGSSTDAAPRYHNTIEAQPYPSKVVPARRARPAALGIHSAVVTGPKGETIHTDRFGRVRVRMLWDEHGHDGEETSCWLRVSQPWAGDGFGTVFVPRVGTEVLVAFVDGDPDRPLCIGSVYDGGNLPPHPLPEQRTRTTIRTASVDGEGFNELSFEDAAGSEEVFLHAQRNLQETIRAHHTTSVGECQRTWIGGSRTTAVGKDDLLDVSGDQTRSIAGSLNDRIRGAVRMRVSDSPKDPTAPKGLEIEVEQGSVDIEAKDSIVLRCGSCRLEIHPHKIVLTGPEIVAQCPSETVRHSTSLAMTEGGIETTADELRQRAVDVRVEADTRVVLGTGADLGKASVALVDEEATILAGKSVEVRAKDLAVVGTNKAEIKGSTCELGGRVVDVRSDRIGIDADSRIEISTPGEVNIRGQEMVRIN